MNSFSTIAVTPPKPTQPQTNPMGSMWVFFLLMIVMMYFLIIRPQSKQRKEQAARVASIEKGDKVVSVGGLHGTVHHVSDKTVTLKLAEGVFVPFEKTAIQTVNKVRSGGSKEEEKKEGQEAADKQ